MGKINVWANNILIIGKGDVDFSNECYLLWVLKDTEFSRVRRWLWKWEIPDAGAMSVTEER